jgi:hypothetical protein
MPTVVVARVRPASFDTGADPCLDWSASEGMLHPAGGQMRKERTTTAAALLRLTALLVMLAGPLAAGAQDPGQVPPGVPASRNVVLELQQAVTVAIERFQAMDRAGVLSQISNQYRTDSITKPAISEELRVMFSLYDTVRAQVHLDEVRTAGEQAWIYSTGEVSGRLRGLGTWMPVLSWKHEPEVARREQGVWRLYGYQR